MSHYSKCPPSYRALQAFQSPDADLFFPCCLKIDCAVSEWSPIKFHHQNHLCTETPEKQRFWSSAWFMAPKKMLLSQSHLSSSSSSSPCKNFAWMHLCASYSAGKQQWFRKVWRSSFCTVTHTETLTHLWRRRYTMCVHTQRGHAERILLAGVKSSAERSHCKSVMIEM